MGICAELPGIQRSIDQLLEYRESLLQKLTALRLLAGISLEWSCRPSSRTSLTAAFASRTASRAIWSGCWIFWMQMSSSFPMPAVPEPGSIVWRLNTATLGDPTTTLGDLIVRGPMTLNRLAVGTNA
jgi:hypothetical protein